MKVVLALAVLVSALLLALAGQRAFYHSSIARSQVAPLHPLRIVRSPQAPKSVRPVHPAAVPIISPSHPLARPVAAQHKA